MKESLYMICYDLETTGCSLTQVDSKYNQIIQIAAKGLSSERTFNSYAKPSIYIPSLSCSTHSIPNRFLKHKQPIKKVIQSFFKWVVQQRKRFKKQRVLLVAHNGNLFDEIVLRNHCTQFNIIIPPSIIFTDTLPFFKLKYPKLRDHSHEGIRTYNLSNLHMYFFGNYFQDAHNALNDVEALKQLFIKCVDCNDPDDIDALIDSHNADPMYLHEIYGIGRDRYIRLCNYFGLCHDKRIHIEDFQMIISKLSANEFESVLRTITNIAHNGTVKRILKILDYDTSNSTHFQIFTRFALNVTTQRKLSSNHIQNDNLLCIYYFYECHENPFLFRLKLLSMKITHDEIDNILYQLLQNENKIVKSIC